MARQSTNVTKTNVFLPLRVALGLIFIWAGGNKLWGLISGSEGTINFFASLGIPAPTFFAWLVGIVEFVGGIFLVIGFLIWWSSLLLAIILAVATITNNLMADPAQISQFLYHLAWIAGLVTLMMSKNTYKAVDATFGWKEVGK